MHIELIQVTNTLLLVPQVVKCIREKETTGSFMSSPLPCPIKLWKSTSEASHNFQCATVLIPSPFGSTCCNCQHWYPSLWQNFKDTITSTPEPELFTLYNWDICSISFKKILLHKQVPTCLNFWLQTLKKTGFEGNMLEAKACCCWNAQT